MDRLPPKKPSLSTPKKPEKTPKKHKGRFNTINNFVDFVMRDLTRVEIAVYLCLWRCEKDGKVQLSQTRIAELVGCSIDCVRTTIKKLKKRGLIIQGSMGNNLTHEASSYKLVN